MKRSEVKGIWSIVHKTVVATDHMVFTTTHVKAETAKKALSFFNEEIADGQWVQKAKIENVKQFEFYEEE